MSHRSQIASIHQQMSINKQAFKKNKQNISKLSNHQCHIKTNADLKDIKNVLKDNLKHLNNNKTNSAQAYECIIKQLKLLLKQAWAKNQFLVRDRAQVLMQNNKLKEALECMQQQLQEHKKQVCELRLNGYSGEQATGLYENGNIFNTLQSTPHLASHHSQYNANTLTYNQPKHTISQIPTPNHPKHMQNSSGQCSSQQQSMLLRQVSQQGLLMSVGGNNNNCNSANMINTNMGCCNSNPHSEQNSNGNNSPSQIMQTPNYNFKSTNFGLNNIKMIPGHFIDIGSQFISKANSCQASGQRQEGLNSIEESSNNVVEISLSNMNNELYLPIGAKDGRVDGLILQNAQHVTSYNQTPQSYQSQHQQWQQHQLSPTNELYLPIDHNKVSLKQQIQTFKQHLNNFGPYFSQSEQHKQQSHHHTHTPQQQPLTHNMNNNSIYITKTDQCKVMCSSNCEQGIFRSFYLSLLRFPLYREKILGLLLQLSHDQSFILYKPYPKNAFWVDLITAFLQMVNAQKQTPLFILQHLNKFKLIDTLMIQALKYRVEYLYNEEIGLGGNEDEIVMQDQSGFLLNGSINNADMQQISNNNNNMIASLTQSPQQHHPSRQLSLQNTAKQPQQLSRSASTTTSQRVVQIFNALANNFDLVFNYSNNRCYQFYNSSVQSDQCNQLEMMFMIENVQSVSDISNNSNNNFVFDFALYYEKSQENTIERDQLGERRQLEEYSVNRQFEDININQRMNTHKRRNDKGMNQSSNLLNSGQYFYNQDSGSSNNRNTNNYNNFYNSNNYNNNPPRASKTTNPHNSNQRQGSFISQTNQYQQQQQDYFTQDISQSTFHYIHHPQQQQIMSENISYRFNNNETTLDVMRNSENYEYYEHQESYESGRRELRERTYNYAINQSLLEEQPSGTKKNILMRNNNNMVITNPTKQLTHALSYHVVNCDNRNKQNQKYYSGNVNQQNFIMKKISNMGLDYDDDSPIQASPSLYDEEY